MRDIDGRDASWDSHVDSSRDCNAGSIVKERKPILMGCSNYNRRETENQEGAQDRETHFRSTD